MKPTGIDDKSAVNQAPLQELLSAAYIVQQHNERLQTGQPPETGYSQILKEIREVQEQLRTSSLGLLEKMALIARRVRQMTQAGGSAIGLLNGDQLTYYAATGIVASQAGASIPQSSSLSSECFRTGQPLHCPDAATDLRLNPALCRSLGIKALIAIPVRHEGNLAGVLEVHFAEPNSFHDQELRTCQLVSGLIAEAILNPVHPEPVPASTPPPPPPIAEEPNLNDPASLLAALEKIRPKLERMATAPVAGSAPYTSPVTNGTSPLAAQCRGCGHAMMENELFCAACGSPRQPQRIWSSLLELQRQAEKSARQAAQVGNPADFDAFDDPLEVFPSELEEIVSKFSNEGFGEPESKSEPIDLPEFAKELLPEDVPTQAPSHQTNLEAYDEVPSPSQVEVESASTVSEANAQSSRPFLLEKSGEAPAPTEAYPPFTGFASDTNLLSLAGEPEIGLQMSSPSAPEDEATIPWKPGTTSDESGQRQAGPWQSAAKAKEWLETEHSKIAWLKRTWLQQRANVYLAAAAVLLAVVLFSWAVPSQPASSQSAPRAGKSHNRETITQPDLSLSEKLLVSLGLAEAPHSDVVDAGNPDVEVWIDLHTALYYCPGADLYGKTPGGKTTTQRQAQFDQFQPASRQACK